ESLAHYYSLDVPGQRRFLAEFLAEFATTSTYADAGFCKEHIPNVEMELLDAFQQLSSTTIEMIISAFWNVDEFRFKLMRALLIRNPKPINKERDAEIVRLRDECDKTFGEIPRILKGLNPAWVRQDGSPMKRDAVEQAYHRQKRKSAD